MKNIGIIEDKDFLTKKQKYFIDSLFKTGFDLPLFYNQNSVEKGDNCPFFSHVFLARPEKVECDKERWNSPLAKTFIELADQFLLHNNLKAKGYFRGCLNFTYNNGKERTINHIDHDFHHKVLLIYCNDTKESSCATSIHTKNGLVHVKPEKYKGVFFDGEKHYMTFPKSGFRAVIVYTVELEDEQE